MKEDESLLTKFIGLIALFLIVVPILALMETATIVQLWEWFLQDEYGKSPSYGAWFGIASIFGVLIMSISKRSDKIEGVIELCVYNVIFVFMACLCVLFSAAIVQAIFSW